jgi:hypothetical protein
MVVVPLFFNFGVDKHTDLPSIMTVQFIATQLHVSGGHYRTIRRLSNKNILKKVRNAYKVYTSFFFVRSKKLWKIS